MSVKELEEGTSTRAMYEPSPVPKPVIVFFATLRKVLGRAEQTRETIHEPPLISHRGTWELRVCLEPDELDGGFVAECLDVPGAMSQGETEQEALDNLIDAVQSIVALKMEEHFSMLQASAEGTQSKSGRVLSVTF